MSRNDITGAEQRTKAATPEYRENHERIFGSTKTQRGRWIQDPDTGQLVPASEYQRKQSDKAQFFLMDRWDAYESETSGRIISNRRQRDYDLKATGCRPYEGKSIELQRAESETKEFREKSRRDMRETMERTYYEIQHGYRPVREN
jgi:hypothetical protein